MEESRKTLHEAKDGDGKDGPEGEDNVDGDCTGVAIEGEGDPHHHRPEHLGQLSVGKAERPQSAKSLR